jgi:hypothetical protein
LTSSNFIQSDIGKITEWSSSLNRYTHKDANKNLISIFLRFLQITMDFGSLNDILELFHKAGKKESDFTVPSQNWPKAADALGWWPIALFKPKRSSGPGRFGLAQS